MAWWHRAGADDVRVGLRASRAPADAGATRVSVTRAERHPGCDFPHMTGVVLRAAPDAGSTPGWTFHRHARYSAGDDIELLYRMPLLACDVHNLALGETRDYTVPVPADAIAGLLFGSLTTKAWIDDGQDVTWLNDHDNQPGLGDFLDRIGTDPLVRVFDVDAGGPAILVTERMTVPLSEFSEDDRG